MISSHCKENGKMLSVYDISLQKNRIQTLQSPAQHGSAKTKMKRMSAKTEKSRRESLKSLELFDCSLTMRQKDKFLFRMMMSNVKGLKIRPFGVLLSMDIVIE